MSDKKTSIENAVERLTANYRKEELFLTKSGRHLPVRAAIIDIVKEMRSVIFLAHPPQSAAFCSPFITKQILMLKSIFNILLNLHFHGNSQQG